MDLPIELQADLIGHVTDLETIARLLQTCSSIRDLTWQSVRKIESDSISELPVSTILAFPRIEEAEVPVQLKTGDDVQRLLQHPILRKLRVLVPFSPNRNSDLLEWLVGLWFYGRDQGRKQLELIRPSSGVVLRSEEMVFYGDHPPFDNRWRAVKSYLEVVKPKKLVLSSNFRGRPINGLDPNYQFQILEIEAADDVEPLLMEVLPAIANYRPRVVRLTGRLMIKDDDQSQVKFLHSMKRWIIGSSVEELEMPNWGPPEVWAAFRELLPNLQRIHWIQ